MSQDRQDRANTEGIHIIAGYVVNERRLAQETETSSGRRGRDGEHVADGEHVPATAEDALAERQRRGQRLGWIAE